jgi:lipopolysaccharide transport system ATP-binding protein
MNRDLAISVRGLSKSYKLGAGDAHDSLRDLLVSGARGLGARRPPPTLFNALRNVSFDIKQGENVGIIGANGAGKSTLLKILSGITWPSDGEAEIRGRVGALLEVGTGFHPELTGRENVFLYGAILGMNRNEVRAKFDAIVAFAEVAQFIDTPVKRYSSGMYVRLAFAVAAHLRPNILLLDEVLAVGDLAFQRKCMAFARGLQQQNATILFVSHHMHSIKTMCDRVIYLNRGQLEYDGPTEAGIDKYERGAELSIVPWAKDNSHEWPISITGIELRSGGVEKSMFDMGNRLNVRISYHAREPIPSPNFMVSFMRSDGVGCSVYTTETDGFETGRADGDGVIELTTPPLKLVAERYTIHVLIRARVTQNLLCAQVGPTFHVRDALLNTQYGVFHEPATWRAPESVRAQAPVAPSEDA